MNIRSHNLQVTLNSFNRVLSGSRLEPVKDHLKLCKYIFILLLVLCGTSRDVVAQNPLDLAGLTSAQPSVGAYSLRNLSASYAGPLVRVVKLGTPNQTLDIGTLGGGELDTVTLKLFAGSDSLFVDIWYDQSGQGNNLESPSVSQMPVLVAAGNILRINGMPAIRFTNSLRWLRRMGVSGVLGASNSTLNMVARMADFGPSEDLLFVMGTGGSIGRMRAIYRAPNSFSFGYAAWGNDAANNYLLYDLSPTSLQSYTAMQTGTALNLSRSGATVAMTLPSTPGTINSSTISIGSVNNAPSTYGTDMFVAEAIAFTSNIGAASVDLETNQAAYYGYQLAQTITLNNLGLPPAAPVQVAYSLRRLSSFYNGNAVQVRKSSNNALLDIGFLPSGVLDTVTLKNFIQFDDAFVTIWYDQSGRGRHMRQTNTALQPRLMSVGAFKYIGGRPAIDFNANRGLVMTGNISLNMASAIAVVQSESTTWPLYHAILDGMGGNPRLGGLLEQGGNTFHGNIRPAAVWRNGMPLSNATSLSPTNVPQIIAFNSSRSDNVTGYCIGNYDGGSAGGSILQTEVVAYSSIMSDADRNTVQNSQSAYYNSIITPYNQITTLGLPATVQSQLSLSFRRLSSAYNGPACIVRRSSDNLLDTIGFLSSGELDTPRLKRFVGSASAFIVQWYDQSGQGNHAIQTNNAFQPRIVNIGIIDRRNGQIALALLGGQTMSTSLRVPQASGINNRITVNSVFTASTVSQSLLSANANELNIHAPWGDGNTYFDLPNAGTGAGGGRLFTSLTWQTLSAGFFLRDSNNSSIWRNGDVIISSVDRSGAANYTGSIVNLFAYNGNSNYMQGAVSELNIFNRLLTNAQLQGVQASQAAYYNISINAPAQIVTQPSTSIQNLCIGSAAQQLRVTASGNNLTYQWYRNTANSNVGGTPVAGATQRFFIPPTTANGITYYYVVAKGINNDSAISEPSGAIDVSNASAPVISSQPSTLSRIYRVNAVPGALSVSATGGGLNYQWFAAVGGSNFAGNPVTGATASTLSPPTNLTGANQYYVVITAGNGCSVTSNLSGVQMVSNNLDSAGLSAISSLPSAAFSLRKLSSTYNGPAILVRRGSDARTTAIGFLPDGNLDTITLKNWVGGGTGTVTTWYDQSGQERHASALATGTEPVIINNGSIVYLNGRVAMQFTGASRLTSSYNLINANRVTANAVFRFSGAGNSERVLSLTNGSNGDANSNNSFLPFYKSTVGGNVSTQLNGAIATNTLAAVNNSNVATTILSTTLINLFVNGANNSTSIPLAALLNTNTLAIGANASATASNILVGFMQEVIMIDNNITTGERTSLENRQGEYYGVSIGGRVAIQTHPSTESQDLCLNGISDPIGIIAVGNATLTYQWYRRTTPTGANVLISGATSATLTPPTNTAGTFYYLVQVTNGLSSVFSRLSGAMVVGSNAASTITTQPSTTNQVISCSNTAATPLTVSATGSGLTYQWFANRLQDNDNGIAIDGANAATYTPPTDRAGTRFYYVRITNDVGCRAISNASGAVTVFNTLNGAALTASNPSAAAFSLRRLSSCYSGPAIQVRRSSDNSIINVGFLSDGTLDTVTLKSFVGGNNGFVTVWYDQSVNDDNQSNLFTFSEQTQSSAFITNGSVPAMMFPDRAVAPDGSISADSVMLAQIPSQWDFHRQAYQVIPGRTYTVSCYVRLATATNFVIVANNSLAWNTIGGRAFTTADGLNTSTWTRVSYTFIAPPNGRVNLHFGHHGNNQLGVPAQTQGSAYLWGFQLNEGSTPSAYERTLNLLTSSRDLIQSATGNQPLIIQSGQIIRANGIPTVRFNGGQLMATVGTPRWIENTTYSVNGVVQPLSASAMYFISTFASGSASTSLLVGQNTANTLLHGHWSNDATFSYTPGTDLAIRTSIKRSTPGSYAFVNSFPLGTSGSPTTLLSNTSGQLILGAAGNSSSLWNGNISEVIVTATDLDLNGGRAVFEQNQGDYYLVSINGGAVVTQQPSAETQNSCIGGTLTPLSIAASGDGLTYQWFVNTTPTNIGGTLIPGATTPTYTPPTTAAGTFYYYAQVTSSRPNTAVSQVSGAIIISGNNAPVITAHPASSSQNIGCTNAAATPLTITVTGSGLSYQWYRNTIPNNLTGILVSGATSASFTPPTALSGTSYYYAIVSNTSGCSERSTISGAINVYNVMDSAGLSTQTVVSRAFGLRRLSACYTGNAITLRRSSDNATTDIGFLPSGHIDTSSILSFIGTSNGLVTQWYNQTGISGEENLITFSDQFDNGVWAKNNFILTANGIFAPDGTPTADYLYEIANTASRSVSQSFTQVVAGTNYTFSVYVRSNGRDWVQLGTGSGFNSTNYFVNFNLQTGTVGSVGAGVTNPSFYSITNAGSGWYRISITATCLTTGTGNFWVGGLDANTASRNPSYAGNVAFGYMIWGGQVTRGTSTALYASTDNSPITLGNHAYQFSAGSQPSIATNGVINRQNGQPTLTFTQNGSNGVGFIFTRTPIQGASFVFSHPTGSSPLNGSDFETVVLGDGTNAPFHGQTGSTLIGSSWANPTVLNASYLLTGSPTSALAILKSTRLRSLNLSLSTPVNVSNIAIGHAPWRSMSGNISEIILSVNQLSETERTALDLNQRAYYNLTSELNVLDLAGLTSSLGVSGAYSLRKLSSTYTSFAIRVINPALPAGTDFADIGFDSLNGNLDTVALLAFANGGNLFIDTWYDQSGNNRHFRQQSSIRRPIIVTNGIVERKNGWPTIRHIASSLQHLSLNTSHIASNTPWTINAVMGLDGGANGRVLSGNSNWLLGFWNGQAQRAFFGAWMPNPSQAVNTLNHIYTTITSGTRASVFHNMVRLFGTVPANAPGSALFTGGLNGTSEMSNASVQEILMFATSLNNTNRTQMEYNQGIYYNIGRFYISKPAGGDWNDPATWELNSVPVSNADVVINTNLGSAVVLNSNATTNTIHVSSGSTYNSGLSGVLSVNQAFNYGAVTTGNLNGLIGPSATFNTTDLRILDSSLVTYNAGQPQTVSNLAYSKLHLRNAAGVKTLAVGTVTTVSDTLLFEPGVTFNKLSGDLTLSSITGSGTLASNAGTLRFNNSPTPQIGTLTMAPAPNNVVDILILANNTLNSSLRLGSKLRVNQTLNLSLGFIQTDTTAVLELANAGIATWNPTRSFINGPVEISTSNTTQRFIPIGKGTIPGAAWVTPNNSSTTTVRVEYFPGANIVPNVSSIDTAGLYRVYPNQYWSIRRLAGSANMTLQFNMQAGQGPAGGIDTENLCLANYSETNLRWNPVPINAQVSATTPLPLNVATPNPVSQFGLFALGSQKALATVQSGAWSDPATWNGGVVPASFQTVYIAPGHQVTLTGDATAAAITVGPTAVLDLTTFAINGTSGGLTLNGTVITSRSTGLFGSLPLCNASNTRINAGSTVIYSGGVAQTVTALTYDDLVIRNSAAVKNLAGSITIRDSLIIDPLCSFNKGGHNLTLNTGLYGAGNLQSTGGALTITGANRIMRLNTTSFTNTSINFATTNSKLLFNGNGAILTGSIFTLNSTTTDTVVLINPVTLSVIAFTNGILSTDTTNIVTITGTGNVGTSISHINGPAQVITSSISSFTLPLADKGVVSNITITPSNTTATTWRIRYSGDSVTSAPLQTGLIDLSRTNKWLIRRNTTTDATIGLGIEFNPGGTALQTLRVAKLANNIWESNTLVNNTIAGNASSAQLITSDPVTLGVANRDVEFAIGFASIPTTITSVASGNWTNTATWNPPQVPLLGDNVIIENGHTVTLDTAISAFNGPNSVVVKPSGVFNIQPNVIYENNNLSTNILDNIFTPAYAAYGLRRLMSSYSGAAIRVRRNIDNDSMDIGFDANGNLDINTMMNFASGGSLQVMRWYDQTGNNRHFTQTIPTRQPVIVNGGDLITVNGAPAIRHSASVSGSLLMTNDLANNTPWTINVVQAVSGTTNRRMLSGSNNWILGFWNGFERAVLMGTWLGGGASSVATTSTQIYSAVSSGVSTNIFLNGTQLTGTVQSVAPGSTLFTTGGNNEFSDGTVQEVIIYNSALPNNARSIIEFSQRNYYINGVIPTSAAGLYIDGTLGISNQNGLDSSVVGTRPTFNAGSLLAYTGADQQVTSINVPRITFTGTGTKSLRGALTITQALNIDNGVTLNLASSDLNFSGTLFQRSGALSSNSGRLILTGSGNLNFGFNGAGKILRELTLNRTGTLTLTDSVIINQTLTLTNGIVQSSVAGPLVLQNANIVGGTTPASYINGLAVLRLSGFAKRTAPVGKNNVIANVFITPAQNILTDYSVEFFNAAPPNATNRDPVITGVSSNHYWNISRNTSNNAVIEFSFNTSQGGTSSSRMVVSGYGASGPWADLGADKNLLANATSGVLASENYVSNFGNFTIGFKGLPVERGLDSAGLSSTVTNSIALSLRRLRSAYVGKVATVRRNSDDALLDVYFNAGGIIDTTTLLSFASGFVAENRILFSEQFENGAWSRTNLNIDVNTATDPIGSNTADQLFETAATAQRFISQGVSVVNGTNYTYAIYVRPNGSNWVQLGIVGGFNTNHWVNFNLATGTVGNTGPGLLASQYSITPAGNGWFRITLTTPATITGTGTFGLWLTGSNVAVRAPSYVGNTTLGIQVWGAQMVMANSAGQYTSTTSYIRLPNTLTVVRWYDQTINGRDAIQTNPVFQPTILNNGLFTHMNSKPVLTYDGVDDGFSITGLPTQTGNVNSVFWVQRTSKNTYMPLHSNTITPNAGSGNWFLIASNGGTETDIIGGSNTHNRSTFWLSGNQAGWSTSTTRGIVHSSLNNIATIMNVWNQPFNWNNSIIIANGHSSTWNFGGILPELFVVNTALDSAQKIAVEVNVGNYYGIASPNNGWVSKATGGDWFNPSTWVQNTVPPVSGAIVNIATTGNNQVTLNQPGNIFLSSLRVNAGARLSVGDSTIIVPESNALIEGTLATANPNGLSGVNATINGGFAIGNNSTIIYNGTGSQLITGTTYRNLVLSNPSSVKSTSGAIAVNLNFQVDSAVTLVQAAGAHTITLNGTATGTGLLRPSPTGTLSIGGVNNGLLGTLNFGQAPNNILGTLTMNRTGLSVGFRLSGILQINSALNLTSGIIFTDTNSYILLNNISTSGGNPASHIDGPASVIIPTINTSRVIHNGKGGFLGAVTVNSGTTTNTQWMTEYFITAPENPTQVGGDMNSLSTSQFWRVRKMSAAAASPTLSFNFNRAINGNATQTVVLSRYITQWRLLNVTANSLNGASITGTLTSSMPVPFTSAGAQQSDFAIGYPAPCFSIASGNWTNPNTWSIGAPPIAGTTVTVRHEVTVDTTLTTGNTPSAILVDTMGQLLFSSTNTFGVISNGIEVRGVLGTQHPSGLTGSLSTTAVNLTPISTLWYNNPITAQSVTGIIANKLRLTGGVKNLIGALTVTDSLILGTGVTFNKAAQNLTINGRYFGQNGTFTSTGGILTLGGTANSIGNLNLTGNLAQFVMARYGVNPSVTLVAPFTAASLDLQSGIVNTDSMNTITLSGATVTTLGSSFTAHINGPMRLTVSTPTNINLPLGNNGLLGNLQLSTSAGTATTWHVQYFNQAPANMLFDSSIGGVSSAHHWNINRLSGSMTAQATFNFNSAPFGGSSAGITMVTLGTGTRWGILPTVSTFQNGSTVNGSLVSANQLSQFGLFTIGKFPSDFVTVASGDWSNPATWLNGNIPTPNSTVVIASGHEVNLTSSVALSSVSITSGAILNMDTFRLTGIMSVDLYGRIRTKNNAGLAGSVPNGSFIFYPSSEVELNGTLQQVNTVYNYRKLTINASIGATLSGALNIQDSLNVMSGYLEINAANFTLSRPFNIDGDGLRINGTSNLTLNNSGRLRFNQASSGATNRLQKLTINTTDSVKLLSQLQIKDMVTVTNGILNSNGNLVLISDASKTASVDKLLGTAAIIGDVTVERFIPAVARRYRCFAPPVTNFTYNQLIDDIFITGPYTGVGFDLTSHTENPSIYTYQDDTTGGRGWKAVSNIGNSLANATGAFVFIRGDRTLPAPQWYTAPYVPQNSTTLDATGSLRRGNVNVGLQYTNTNDTANDGWNLVGNPYASAIDWASVLKTNISPFLYILDPATGSYTVASSGKIESGQSFFVKAIGSGAALGFTENSKTTTGGVGLFKTIDKPFTIQLVKDAITSDLAQLRFGPSFNAGFNYQEDAIKLDGGILTISLMNKEKKLHINAMPPMQPTSSDTFWVNISGSNGTYIVKLLNVDGLPKYKNAFITDTWLNVTYPFASDTSIQFNITSNAASKGNRFRITFQPSNSLPAKLIAFSGKNEGDKGNRLNWITASEENVREFIVERRSAGEKNFTAIGSVQANGKVNATTNYSYLDADADFLLPFTDYRLRIADFSGKEELSHIITIKTGDIAESAFAQVYPNPAKQGENVNLQYNPIAKDKDVTVMLYTTSGVLLETYNEPIESISTAKLRSGVYVLEVWLGEEKQTIKLVIL